MQHANRFAFKEWAAICEAIAVGRQSIIVRKGGIHERRDDFTVDHNEFWLFPTRFHEGEDDLTEDGRHFLRQARPKEPERGIVRFSVYFEVTDVVEIHREDQLPRLRSFHIYDDRVLAQRFHYKRPGLTILVGRASVSETPHEIPDSPHFGGCRSWVDLPSEIPTDRLTPVFDNETFSQQRLTLLAAVGQNAVL